MVSEVSVHGRLTPLLWDCGEAEQNGKEGIVKDYQLPIMPSTYESMHELINTLIDSLIDPCIHSLIRSEPLGSNHFPIDPLNNALRTKPSTYDFWEIISYSHHNAN
jgi:hypothetical protein